MILADTSVWIDYFNGVNNWQTNRLHKSLSEETVLTGDILLAEILQGFKRETDYQTAKEVLDILECVQIGGKELALKSAVNFRLLRSNGITVRKTVDMLVGTWCIECDISLLQKDRDFDSMANCLPLKLVAE